MPTKQVWVARSGREWQVSSGRSVIATCRTQREAIAVGRGVAEREQAELIWQTTDGKIQGRNPNGKAPRRPQE